MESKTKYRMKGMNGYLGENWEIQNCVMTRPVVRITIKGFLFSILKPLLSAPSRLSQRLEVECRILFPLTFMGFCLCYWIYYCHIMDESEAIMENVTMYKIHDEN